MARDPASPFELIGDIQDSFKLAMKSAGIDDATIEEVNDTVTDYVVNTYGDD